MTKTAKPAPAKGGVHNDEAGTYQHFSVGNFLLQPYFENTTETLDVEGVDSLLLLF